MRCLVTGAGGYIGDNLTKRLASEGYEVRGLLHINKPKSDFYHKKIEYVTGDITDKDALRDIIKNIDVVFHCAAITKDYGNIKLFHQVNVIGTKNIAEVSEEEGVQRFVFLSSIRVTGKKLCGLYPKTKILAEKNLMEMYRKNNFPVVIIRPGDVYGPGATIWVLRVLLAIKKNRIALIDHGKGIFHHVYIDNLLDAMVSAIEEPRAAGETFVITDGDNDTTWGFYLNTLAAMIGKPPIKKNLSKNTASLLGKIMTLLYNIFEIEPLVTPMAVEIFTDKQKISIEKAQKILKYQPKISFEEGLDQIKKWFKNKDNVYKNLERNENHLDL